MLRFLLLGLLFLTTGVAEAQQRIFYASAPQFTVLPPAAEVAAPVAVTPEAVSNRWTRAELEAMVRAKYPRGFAVRYADVSPRSAVWSHLKSGVHGFSSAQVDGMPQWIALGLHDMEHGGEITPFRTQASAGCVNGRCPTPMQPQYRTRAIGRQRR